MSRGEKPKAEAQVLRALMESRRETIDRVRARVKEQNRMEKQITGALGNGPRTVPEISREAHLPAQTVFWYLMALKKYGKVTEGREQDSYLTYLLREE